MGSHSETAFCKRVDERFEELSNKLDAGINNIDRRLQRLIWKVAGLYAYLLAWLIWFYFEFRS